MACTAAADALFNALVAELPASTALLYVFVAIAFASVAKVGSAPRKASPLAGKFAGSDLLGGVGKDVLVWEA